MQINLKRYFKFNFFIIKWFELAKQIKCKSWDINFLIFFIL